MCELAKKTETETRKTRDSKRVSEASPGRRPFR